MVNEPLQGQDPFWDEAQRWLWRQREKAPANADVWHLRYHWQEANERMWDLVQKGTYCLTLLRVYRGGKEQGIAQWSSADALVLKWCALHIDGKLPIHERCEHYRGNGGAIASVKKVREALESEEY